MLGRATMALGLPLLLLIQALAPPAGAQAGAQPDPEPASRAVQDAYAHGSAYMERTWERYAAVQAAWAAYLASIASSLQAGGFPVPNDEAVALLEAIGAQGAETVALGGAASGRMAGGGSSSAARTIDSVEAPPPGLPGDPEEEEPGEEPAEEPAEQPGEEPAEEEKPSGEEAGNGTANEDDGENGDGEGAESDEGSEPLGGTVQAPDVPLASPAEGADGASEGTGGDAADDGDGDGPTTETGADGAGGGIDDADAAGELAGRRGAALAKAQEEVPLEAWAVGVMLVAYTIALAASAFIPRRP